MFKFDEFIRIIQNILPTCASNIMLTSLAPSPIANVGALLWYRLTSDTTCFFQLGENLHPITLCACNATSINSFAIELSFDSTAAMLCSRIWKHSPWRIKPCFIIGESVIALFAADNYQYNNVTVVASSTCNLQSYSIIEAAILTDIAVSCLSPVSTQNRIPASLIYPIVVATSSWSLSSTAVTPSSCNFLSN